MKLLLALACLLLGSCATHHVPVAPGRDFSHAEGTAAVPYRPVVVGPVDSLSNKPVKIDKQTDKPSLYRRLFPSKQQVSANQRPDKLQPVPNHAQPVPRKCKGCTFIVAGGDASIVGKKAQAATGDGATTTTIGKVKAPTAIGDSATAQDFTKQGQRGGAAASAPGATATATTEKETLLATLLPWLGVAAGGAALYFFGWPLLVALFKRKQKPDDAT